MLVSCGCAVITNACQFTDVEVSGIGGTYQHASAGIFASYLEKYCQKPQFLGEKEVQGVFAFLVKYGNSIAVDNKLCYYTRDKCRCLECTNG